MQKRLTLFVVFVFTTGALLAPGLHSEAFGFKSSLSAGVGRMDGDLTYKIGGVFYDSETAGRAPMAISKLEFPLETYMLTVDFGMEFANRWEINITGKTNVLDSDGVMKDSDYLSLFWDVDEETGEQTGDVSTGEELGMPDVYSESDVDLDAIIGDFNIRYRIVGTLYAGVGYIYQNYDYEMSDFRQWYPLRDYYSLYDSAYYSPGISGTGVGLTYEITTHIPYLELAAKGNISENFTIGAYFRYSPMVKMKDEDNHLQRVPPILAQGECDGDAYILALNAKYKFARRWFLDFQFDYTKIDTKGDQKNYTEGTYAWTTDEEISSTQMFYSLSLGFSF